MVVLAFVGVVGVGLLGSLLALGKLLVRSVHTTTDCTITLA